MRERELVALLDMDGTLADYDGAMKRELAKLASPDENPFEHGDNLPDWIEARRTVVSRVPGFWRNLEKLEVGFEIVHLLEAAGFSLQVLTKGPSSKSLAWAEKLEWCREHIPQAGVTITEDKSRTWGKILVDDWTPYFMKWLGNRPRGLVIVPSQPWNQDVESLHQNIVRYDGKDPKFLRACIHAVATREGKEPLVLPQR